MAAIYNVGGHGQLSTAALALNPAQLNAAAEAAERMQDLRVERFSGDNLETAKLVVVYQINSMLAQGAVLSQVASVGRGARSISYRLDSGGKAIVLDERASQLRDDLRAWCPVISKR